MAVRDTNVDWLRKHVFVPADCCNKVISTNQVTTVTGAASLLEVTSAAITGFELNADAEAVSATLCLPFDMDPSFTLKFRIHYTGKSTTAADKYVWNFKYNNVKRAAAAATPATAPGVDFAATNVLSGTAYQIGVTDWAAIAADTWTRAEIEAAHIIGCLFTLTSSEASLASSEEAYFLGFEYSYVLNATRGSGSRGDWDAA
jgi:hypothetical protein